MLRLLGYLLGMAGTLYLAAIYSSHGIVLVFVIELVFFLADLSLLFYRWKRLGIRLEFPLPAAERGQEVPLELVVDNPGRFPAARETVYLKYKRSGSRRTEKLKLHVFTGKKGSVRFSNKISGFSSGSYYFEKAVAVWYDPLGLLRLQKSISLHERLDIMPEIYSVGVTVSEPVRNFMGESDVYDSIHSGEDASEIFQLREFREGDKLKDIHWKLSAKEDEWIVRENGKPIACAVVLLIDFAEAKKKHQEKRDVLLSLAASISFALVENKCPHYAAWFSTAEQDIVRIRVDSEERLNLFLMNILGEAAAVEKRDLKQAYKERYQGENYLADICIDDSLQVVVKGETIGTCDGRDPEKSLEEMVLRV